MYELADVLIVGLGAFGSSTAFALARRGRRVIAIDRYAPGHERGSSHGDSRAIRLAYFEHPSYVPLIRAAYESWRELEALTGKTILTTTGILEMGQSGSAIVAGSLAASRMHGIPQEHLSAREVRERFPQFRVPDGWSAVYQRDGGFLRPELAIKQYVALARQQGAEVRVGVRARSLIEGGEKYVGIMTDQGPIHARRLVIAAGPWITDLVPELRPHLTLTRQVQCWFRNDTELFASGCLPIFIMDTPEDLIYGFPNFDGHGVKIASHHSSGVLQHADQLVQDGSPADQQRLLRVIENYLPGAAGPVTKMRTCLYTRTADEDFIIDRHPGDDRIIVASPCSGHGFKFASVVGNVLADLATIGSTEYDISRFRLGRFEFLAGR